MLTIHQARKPDTPRHGRIGLAIAGGGPVGAIYELGALRALEESVEGLRLHDLDVYVGISAGGVIAASLANRIPAAEMCRIFMGHPGAEFALEPDKLLKPAYREYLNRAARIPGILLDALTSMARHPMDASVSRLMGALGQALPTGIFENDALHDFLRSAFESSGRTNDFRELRRRLIIVAVELDNGAAVRFGAPDRDHVPISRAVQASAALPGLYPPVEIDGQYYVDGALRRTLNASAALDQGVDLLLAINPLVPFAAGQDPAAPAVPVRRLIRGGLPLVLSQTFRALIQSRMNIGFRNYRESHPGTDFVLVEPDQGDEEIFFTNIFSFASRTALCDHAYRVTKDNLRRRADEIESVLARHGMHLDRDVLEQRDKSLADSLGEAFHGHSPVSRQLGQALEDLECALRKRA
ncbi:patatin-like phospholipase family protein [Elongatibacter sediminis]|uniref:Patatin-like phospholipase family protein n=1 Tax=Elongatibacter sediminis TaxID=3119006 RepID=A0AAW9RGE6_9GAMM